MGKVIFVCSEDVNSIEVNNYIASIFKQYSSYIHLVPTEDYKEIRKQDLYIKFAELSDSKLYTISEYKNKINKKICLCEDIIGRYDEMYILESLISDEYQENKYFKTFCKQRKDIFKLYDYLIFNGIKKISKEVLDDIKSDFSTFDYEIFNLYNKFLDKLKEKSFYMENKEYDLFQTRLKSEIKNNVNNNELIVLDGFIFLNNVSHYIAQYAITHNKDIYFILKFNPNDLDNRFIYERYKNTLKWFESFSEIVFIDSNKTCNSKSINFVRENIFKENFNNTNIPKCEDIKIIKPFKSSYDELNFLAREIGNYIKNKNISDVSEIKNIIKNDIAIIRPPGWNEHSYKLKSIFETVGVFVYNGTDTGGIDRATFKNVYFSEDQFLNEDVRYSDGNKVNIYDKRYIFKSYFNNLKIDTRPRSITSFPIGQYIKQIYSIITNGITIQGFEKLIYSNWNYHVKSERKWDKFISQFKHIQSYLEDGVKIEDWIEKIKNLIKLKKSIENNNIFKDHFLYNIDSESMEFFIKILENLRFIISKLKKGTSIKEHIKLMKDYVFYFNNYSLSESKDTEKEVVKKLMIAVDQISANSVLKEVDIDYFSKNIEFMLEDWQRENLINNKNDFYVNEINLDNIKSFKHCFLVTCEEGKYPKYYNYNFPFTKNIINILSNPRYKINVPLAEIYDEKYHIELEKFLFKNMLDFTKEKLVITYTQYNKKGNDISSIYVEDIATLFNSNVNNISISDKKIFGNILFIENVPEFKISRKDYTISEVMAYKLCPIFFRHFISEVNVPYESIDNIKICFENILFISTINKFCDENFKQDKVYSIFDTEVINRIIDAFDFAFKENIKYFGFLTKGEINSVKEKCIYRIENFIYDNAISKSDCSYFRILPYENKYVEIGDKRLIIKNNNCIIHRDKRIIFPYDVYMNFGVRKSEKYNKRIPSNDYEILRNLDENRYRCDRINLVTQLIYNFTNKIINNVDCNRTIKTIRSIIYEIENMDFNSVKGITSSYCNYCRFYCICKNKNRGIRGDTY